MTNQILLACIYLAVFLFLQRALTHWVRKLAQMKQVSVAVNGWPSTAVMRSPRIKPAAWAGLSGCVAICFICLRCNGRGISRPVVDIE